MQMPSSGRPVLRYRSRAATVPLAPSWAIASPKAPTPGRITASARAISPSSRVRIEGAPMCSSACMTEQTLPAP